MKDKIETLKKRMQEINPSIKDFSIETQTTEKLTILLVHGKTTSEIYPYYSLGCIYDNYLYQMIYKNGGTYSISFEDFKKEAKKSLTNSINQL